MNERAERRRFLVAFVLPTLLLFLGAVIPQVLGSHTFYLRDVLNTHFEMKWVQAETMRQGVLPAVDLWRSAGQPHLGNPNTVPLYPSNLLYLVASPLWALNAHLWLHLLVAPVGGFWLGRAWGLSRSAAWACGVVYAGGGYLLSTLNLYNLVAAAALTPAFVAACLRLRRRRGSPSAFVAVGGLWALLLLGGDPMSAAMAGLLALTAVAVRGGRRGGVPWPAGLSAVGLGSLLTAPQWVEFLRVLPFTYRGHQGYSAEAALAASWHPANLAELFVPFFFGRPDFDYWGQALHSGQLPLFFTLYPGGLALVLALVACRRRGRAFWWAAGIAVAGALFALGEFNPAVGLLLRASGAGLLRLPVKFWLLVAVGGALLAGIGFEGLRERGHRRLAGLLLAGLAAAYLLVWAGIVLFPGAAHELLRAWIPPRLGDAFVEEELLRLRGVCLALTGLLALQASLLRAWRRSSLVAAVLLLSHGGSQLVLLAPVLARDEAAPYLEPPALLEVLGDARVVAHGGAGELFGPSRLPAPSYPDASLRWMQRQRADQLHPPAGVRWGLRYALHLSPEGMDSFLTRAVARAVPRLSDRQRVRVLAASGVDTLLLDRELDTEALAEVRLLGSRRSWGRAVRAYRLERAAAPVQLVGAVQGSRHLDEALARLLDPDFEPRRAVVLAGEVPERQGPGGRAEILEEDVHALRVRVEAPSGGVLLVQRAFLPIYRAAVDGEPAPLAAANLHRMGLEVPAGSHEVRIWVDRRPTGVAWLAALLAVAGLALAPRLLRSTPPPPSGEER